MDQIKSARNALQTVLVVVSLVHTIMDSFGSASGLYRKLKKKEERIEDAMDELKGRHGMSNRHRRDNDSCSSQGSHTSRRREHRRDQEYDYSDSDEESLCSSGPLVRREYDRGYHHIGHRFAVGDIITQNQLQAQIIALQQTIITIFQESAQMYGPTRNPISHHLAQLLDTARATRSGAIDALSQQYQRMLTAAPLSPAVPIPTALTIRSRPERSDSRDSAVATISGPTSVITRATHGLYCIYALDLQNHTEQPLADNFKDRGDGRCPYCSVIIPTRPGRAWEIVREDEREGVDRTFLVQNRFVVKSHREGGKFACILCSQGRPVDTVCESVAGLVDHIWKEHFCEEYERDIDIVKVG